MLGLGLALYRQIISNIRDIVYGNLETEGGLNLAQENGYLLVLEQDS